MICAARRPPMVGDNVGGYKGSADNSERGVNMLTTQTSLQTCWQQKPFYKHVDKTNHSTGCDNKLEGRLTNEILFALLYILLYFKRNIMAECSESVERCREQVYNYCVYEHLFQFKS